MVVIDAWSRYFVELASRPCFQTNNIAPHISLHDLPYHKTMKKYEDFQSMEAFLFTPLKSRFEHGSVLVHNIFAYLALSLSASQVYMIEERCSFSQIDFFVEYFPHRINVLFLSSQFYVIHIHK